MYKILYILLRHQPGKYILSLILWVVLMGGFSIAEAQEIIVSSPFAASKTRNEAVTRPRVDFNHDTCALVIINLDFEDVDFEGDIKLMQYRDGEWWVYLSPGANWLTILSEMHTPLRVEFAPVRAATTYTLGLRAPVTLQTIEVADPCRAEITMVDARRFSRNDASGRTCALIRIGFVQPNVEFSGAVDKEYRRGEWWVWFPVGTTSTTVDVVGFEPLTITFEPLQTAVTYLMTLRKGGTGAPAATPKASEPKPEPKPIVYDDETPAMEAFNPDVENYHPVNPEIVIPKAQQTTVQVSGMVFSKENKQPLSNVAVSLKQNGHTVAYTMSRESGSFDLNVPLGSYVIEAVHPQYGDYVTSKPIKVSGATVVDPIVIGSKGKQAKTPKEPKTSSGSTGGWSWGAALESTVVPGLGQVLKGRWGSGIATFLGEAALAGGIFYTYTLAEEQLAIIENNNTSYNRFQRANADYKTYQMVNIGLIGAVAAVHVYNIIRAGTIKPRQKGGLALGPSLLPADGTVTPSLSLTFTF